MQLTDWTDKTVLELISLQVGIKKARVRHTEMLAVADRLDRRSRRP
jgi:hypothetical protein